MKIEELRLGNITKQGIVFMIGYDRGILGCWFIKNKYDSFADGFVKADDIEPIPLTPEILEKAGFEFDDESVLWYLPMHYYYENECADFVIYDTSCSERNFSIQNSGTFFDIEYVHQLQNLFFALTREELEIKL